MTASEQHRDLAQAIVEGWMGYVMTQSRKARDENERLRWLASMGSGAGDALIEAIAEALSECPAQGKPTTLAELERRVAIIEARLT